jgi:hypothetical protein
MDAAACVLAPELVRDDTFSLCSGEVVPAGEHQGIDDAQASQRPAPPAAATRP